MTKKKKHTLKLEFEHDYTLIVIRSVLQDFRMAYYLNLVFNLQLKKENFTVTSPKKGGNFTVFGFENLSNDQYWSLIANKQIIQLETGDSFNFFHEISNTFTFLKEEKKADYFLKIENNNIATTTLIKRINSIHKVITSYVIDPNELKSKNTLIF